MRGCNEWQNFATDLLQHPRDLLGNFGAVFAPAPVAIVHVVHSEIAECEGPKQAVQQPIHASSRAVASPGSDGTLI